MASQQRSVGDMVESLLGESFELQHPLEILASFREAFGLTLAHVKPIAEWLASGRDEASKADLHRLIWPYIERK